MEYVFQDPRVNLAVNASVIHKKGTVYNRDNKTKAPRPDHLVAKASTLRCQDVRTQTTSPAGFFTTKRQQHQHCGGVKVSQCKQHHEEGLHWFTEIVVFVLVDGCVVSRASDKCLVFSQWDDMLDIVELAFKENEVRCGVTEINKPAGRTYNTAVLLCWKNLPNIHDPITPLSVCAEVEGGLFAGKVRWRI